MYSFGTIHGDYTYKQAYIGCGPAYVQLQNHTCTVSMYTCHMCDVARHALSLAHCKLTSVSHANPNFIVKSSVHAT